jgi:hypothetical protein
MHGYPRDIVADIYRQPFLYDQLLKTDDQDVIGQVISDEGVERDDFKVFLAQRNPHLTDANFRALAVSKNYQVRAAVAARRIVPIDVLNRLLADEIEEVRVGALWNSQTDVKTFTDAVLHGKYSKSAKKGFCHNEKAVKSFEVFNLLWNTVRGSHSPLVDSMNYAVRENAVVIDPKILNVVHDEIRYGNISKALKESYAGAAIALPEILDDWKDDPNRDVVTAIARNDAAWLSTHEYLVDNYRSGHIRMFVAQTTDNFALLNKLYHDTKNRATLDWIENNPAFAGGSEG